MKKEKQSQGDACPSYKETLNLLKTSFGMRANSSQREPELQAFWKEKGIDFELGLNNKGQSFTLHDGPPYANGSLHMGHALNKVLKDIINKYKILKGCKVHFIPGWDCHGLPIELKVLQKLDHEKRQSLTPIKLRKKAAEYALKQVENQKKGFKRWGVWGDWENPYLTLNSKYEASQIKVFGSMALKGHIYRGLKPVHWSPSSKTALAEAELEYSEAHISQSIYVAFPVVQLPNSIRNILLDKNIIIPDSEIELGKILKLAIWTTTPWTIPANLAISVNEKLDYVFAKNPEGKIFIIAADLIEKIQQKIVTKLEAIAFCKGSLLTGIYYKHSLFDRKSPVVIGGDYITTESGTGLVHTAPGHGVDDFNTGKKYNLPIICVVDDSGYLTEEAGQFKGLNVIKDANRVIIDALIENGSLLLEESYSHRYPYDWRTKKPTIFRATEQWFASIDGFREEAMLAIEKTNWLPLSGRNRIESMVGDRGDWCISRQRIWGVPIPVFYEKNGKNILLNEETLEHIHNLISHYGSDIWWQLDESELLPSAYSSEADRWRKGTDTMDVWFDSGSSWEGVCNSSENLNYPADLYLEGSDQHRGWFQSSLLTSVAVNNRAPFRNVLTHGFALDENGRKMSKSLGNIIDPYLIIDGGNNQKKDPPYGADVLRLWVSSVDYSVDVPIGKNILRQISDVYRKVRNTSRYLLGNLHDFQPSKDSIKFESLPIIDKWMMQRTSAIIEEITSAYEQHEFSRFFQIIQSFCVIDLSNFYLDIAKDRLYVSSPDDKSRRSCQTVISHIIENFSVIISPVLCHMAEDIWQNIPYYLPEESVFLRGWPKVSNQWKDDKIIFCIDELRELRGLVNKVIEDCRINSYLGASLEAAVRIDPKSNSIKKALDFIQKNGDKDVDNFKDWLLVSNLQIGGEPWAEILVSQDSESALIEVTRSKGEKCNRCWHYKNDLGINSRHPNICSRCVDILEGLR